MHTHEDTLKILGCSKMTLSRYVKENKLTKIKKGRNTYYDEVEVALLIRKIDDNKKKVGIEISPREKIDIPSDVEHEVHELSADTKLNRIGMNTLFTATRQLTEMGIFKECDKQILLCYALSVQAYNHYFSRCMEVDLVVGGEKLESDDGTVTIHVGRAGVHPYHKMMMEHQRQMLMYSDRLGLNPLARQKFDIKEPKKESIMDIINGD